MDEQRQDDQLKPIHNSSVPIQDVTLKTSREQWTIETGGESGSRRSVKAARHDGDDDDASSSVWFSNHSSEAMHNASAHQLLPRYYQPQ